MATPRKVNYPVTLDKLLRLTFPKKRKADRWKFYRLEVRERLWGGHIGSPPTENEIESEISKDLAQQFDMDQATRFIMQLHFDLPKFEYAILKERAKAGAAGRWKKS